MKKNFVKNNRAFAWRDEFSALAEQTVDIEIRGIKGERAIRNTDMNVNSLIKVRWTAQIGINN